MNIMDEQQSQTNTPNTQNNSPSVDEVTGVDADNLIAALSYLGVLVIVPILVKRQDPFTNFHIKQGIVILAGYVIASVLFFLPPIASLLWLAMIVCSIAGFVQALRGKRWKIPGIGDIATKFSI